MCKVGSVAENLSESYAIRVQIESLGMGSVDSRCLNLSKLLLENSSDISTALVAASNFLALRPLVSRNIASTVVSTNPVKTVLDCFNLASRMLSQSEQQQQDEKLTLSQRFLARLNQCLIVIQAISPVRKAGSIGINLAKKIERASSLFHQAKTLANVLFPTPVAWVSDALALAEAAILLRKGQTEEALNLVTSSNLSSLSKSLHKIAMLISQHDLKGAKATVGALDLETRYLPRIVAVRIALEQIAPDSDSTLLTIENLFAEAEGFWKSKVWFFCFVFFISNRITIR